MNMKKNILLCCLVFSVLPLWADVFHPDSSRWVTVELHDRDTVELDSAALYRFSQATDTVRNVLVLCKSIEKDTILSSIDITGLNAKDFKFEVKTRWIMHIDGDAVFSGNSSANLQECEIFIDVDTLPDINCIKDVRLNISRGAISKIEKGICRIGENMTGRISIQNIRNANKTSYLFNGEVGFVNYPEQFIQEGGKVLGRYFYTSGSDCGNRNDTAVIINGGEVAKITKNGDQVAIVNGGTIGFLDMGNNGHCGNVYLNGGEIRTSIGDGFVKWWHPNKGEVAPVDTLFFDQHAIVAYGHDRLEFRNSDGTLKLDDILSLNTIVGTAPLILVYENLALGERTLRVESTAVDGDRIYNMTRADSLLVWDFLSIYESKKCTIHYQVADGVAPEDTTYQEGLVRYFTTVPTRTFYDFVGWYADSTYTIRVDSLDEWSRGDTTLWAKWKHSSEIPSLSIMIAQGNCLAVRNPEGFSEVESAYFTWVHQDTIVVNGMDSIISDTLPSHKMYVEVGDPIPQGRYTAIIRIEEGWTVYVSRYIPATVLPTSSPRNSNKRTLFYIGSYMLEVDDKGNKYLIKP